jgi:hypothetical protein
MSLGRFFDRYYIINALIILSYGLLRMVKDAPELQRPDDYLGLSKVQINVKVIVSADACLPHRNLKSSSCFVLG